MLETKMKTKILLVCLVLGISIVGACYGMMLIGGSTVAAGASCDEHYAFGGTPLDNYRGDINISNNTMYVGAVYNNATGGDICRVDFHIAETAGDISGDTFTAYLYAESSGDIATVGSPLATSDNYVASGGESSYIQFDFSSPYTYTGSTNIIICVTKDQDATNVGTVFMSAATGTYDIFRWDNTGALYTTGGRDTAIKVYYQ